MGDRESCRKSNAGFQRIARKDERAFLNEQCKEIGENNRKGKTGDLFKKIGAIKGSFCATMDMIKDKNGSEPYNSRRHQEEVARIYRGIISERSECPCKPR